MSDPAKQLAEAVIHISADVSFLVVIRRFIQAAAGAMGVGADSIEDVVHAVDELSANIILHGYDGRPGLVEIHCRMDDDALVVTLRDTAPPFDPTTVAEPDLDVPLEQRRVGGLGIYLSRKMMDDMRYQRLPTGQNELTLVKRTVTAG